MQGILFEEPSIGYFLFVTGILGGSAAWMTGRAIAITWRPFWTLLLYLLILSGFVRFIHFALFRGTLLSLHFYIIDAIVLLIIGSLGYRYYQARLMTRQYGWLYERTGPFGWREKTPGTGA